MSEEKIRGENNYKLFDLIKFLCAYLVIGIHTRPFQAISLLIDKLLFYNISNYAVPFFYACTGYFLISRQSKSNLHTQLIYRIKKIAKIYVIWSVVYLPLTVYGWFTEGNQSLEYVIFCIRNYILVGDNFYSWALWYLNGLIFAMILIDILSKRITIEQIVKFGSVAYLFGIVLTMLGGHQEKLPALVALPVNIYFSVFATTRNGLFQSLVFVAIGMMVAEKEKQGEINAILKKGKILIPLYVAKIPISLIGGGSTSVKLLTCRYSMAYLH